MKKMLICYSVGGVLKNEIIFLPPGETMLNEKLISDFNKRIQLKEGDDWIVPVIVNAIEMSH